MNHSPPINRHDFEFLVRTHQELIRLANELEYQLYRLGEGPTPEHVTECQQAGGALIGMLREVLFRSDQQVLPLLDGWTAEDDKVTR
jgi:hypothetical protein